MVTLKELSLKHTAKREITDLDKVSVDLEVQEGSFEKDGKTIGYKFVKIDDYSYTIKSKTLTALKSIVTNRPQTKFVKFDKTESGDIVVIPLD